MDTILSLRLSRFSKLLLAGVGAAFALVLLSVAFCCSPAHAHTDDDAGLHGIAAAAAGHTEATTAALVPVVPLVAAEVDPVVPVVVAAPAETVSEAAASTVAAPIVAVVDDVPIIAEVVSGLEPVVDSVIDPVIEVVDGPGSAVITPEAPRITILDPLRTDSTLMGRDAAAASPLEIVLRAASLTGTLAWSSITSGAPAAATPADGAALIGGPLSLLRSVLQADSVLTGSAGAGPGAWALAALSLVIAYRAWMRRARFADDMAPPAPAYPTEVSPD